MNLKWYIGTLVVILSLLGIVNQEQRALPNQEIVLQFKGADLSAEDAQATIAIVKKELKNIGVHNFKVKENENGRLKVSYYSDADVNVVKRLLSKRIRAELDGSDDKDEGPFELPSEDKNALSYNLDVYEIQNANDVDSDLSGIIVLELKLKSDRFFKPKSRALFFQVKAKTLYTLARSAFKVRRNYVLSKHSTLRDIPEVRAGPIC